MTGHRLKLFPSRLKRALARFHRDESGGLAITFGLAFVPVAFLSLVMIDYSRASTARQALQETLDAATLIAARSTAILQDDLDKIGDKALAAQLPANLGISGLTPDANSRISGATFSTSGTIISSTATGKVSPIVANLFLGGPIQIRATSEVVRSVNKLEIAMVLDTTGSMEGDKLENLIESATNFVTTMETASMRSTETNAVKIAIVPFSTTVKVSAPISVSSYNNTTHSMSGLPSWLDGRARSTLWNKDLFTTANASVTSRIDRFTLLKQMNKPWGGCVEARKSPYDVQEDAPTNTDTYFTPFFWPDAVDSWGGSKNSYISDGSSGVVSGLTDLLRQLLPSKYNTTSVASGTWSQGNGYGAALDKGPNAGCKMQEMKRLTTDFNGLRTTISGLVASGETNIPIGLAWGWHALSPNAPLSDGVAYGTPKTTKIIVLMTDGDNTMNDPGDMNDSWYHGYGYVWQNKLSLNGSALGGTSTSSQRTQALNAKMITLCSNIRAKNIIIYTIGVGVSSTAREKLTECKGTTGAYYDVDSSGTNLNAAFSAIAGSIENLRISK